MTTTATKPMSPATEMDQLRQQLLQAQKMSSVGALASSVAHEFNNILTTIINYAKLGLKTPDEAEKQAALEKIFKAGQRAAGITGSMLGFARKSGHGRTNADVVALIEEVLVLTRKDLEHHRIAVETKFHDRPLVPAVAGQIEQVLLNLVINARQAMPKGGKLRIDVRENRETQMAEIRLADTGCGIAPEKLRLVFEPFYTTKRPDEQGHGGTGLGLSVCRQIIEQHQGRIRVESVVGKGSAFTLKLPVRQEAD